MGLDLNTIARAYLERERQRVGIPAQEQVQQATADQSMVQQAQARHILSSIPTQEEDAAKLDLIRAQAEQARAHGVYYQTPKAGAVPSIKAALDDAGNVIGFYATKPDANGKIRFYNHGDLIPGNEQAPASSGSSPAPSTTAPTPSPATAVPATAAVPGSAAAPVPSFRSAPKPRAPQPTYIQGTDAQGNPTFVNNHTLQPAPVGSATPPLTQIERTRRDQSAHVIDQGNALLAELDKPEVRAVMGPRQGLVTAFKDTGVGGFLTGGAPPEATHLAGSLSSLSAFLPIMHGMRGGENMIGHFEHVLGKQGELAIRRNPEAVKSAVMALMEAAKRIREQGPTADLTDLAPTAGSGNLDSFLAKHGAKPVGP